MLKFIILLAFLISFILFDSDSPKERSNENSVATPTATATPIYCPPGVFALEKLVVVKPCPKDSYPSSDFCSDDMTIGVKATATSPKNNSLSYKYNVSGGKISGQGSEVKWDLTGVEVGFYTIEVTVDDGDNYRETSARAITVKNCGDCKSKN